MNKLLKGSVAGAAGVALLLGGAGSFALWNSTQELNVGSVASGTLSIAAVADTAAWSDVSTGVAVPIANIANFKIAPGDTIKLTQDVEIDAVGDNLRATLSYDADSLATLTPADDELLADLDISLEATTLATNIVRIPTTDTFAVTPAASTSTVKLTVTIVFPAEKETGKDGTVNLSNLAFKLQQNDR